MEPESTNAETTGVLRVSKVTGHEGVGVRKNGHVEADLHRGTVSVNAISRLCGVLWTTD